MFGIDLMVLISFEDISNCLSPPPGPPPLDTDTFWFGLYAVGPLLAELGPDELLFVSWI